MTKALVYAILVGFFSATSFTANAAVLKLKCIDANKINPSTGELTITYEEGTNGITGEMAYSGQYIKEGKLIETNFSEKLIGKKHNTFLAQTHAGGGKQSYTLINRTIDLDTGDFYSYIIDLFFKKDHATMTSVKTMTCAIKE